jgi:hypothetical protein
MDLLTAITIQKLSSNRIGINLFIPLSYSYKHQRSWVWGVRFIFQPKGNPPKAYQTQQCRHNHINQHWLLVTRVVTPFLFLRPNTF